MTSRRVGCTASTRRPAATSWLTITRTDPIGDVTIETDGALLLFGDTGRVTRFAPADGTADTVVAPDPVRFNERFNDVVADPEGRVFAGVMPDPARDLPGQLYRLDTDGSFELVRDRCGLPNGMGFTGDLASMYFTDSRQHDPERPGSIYRYAYDRASGAITDPVPFVDAADLEGMPDGLTVDEEDHVWSAFWNGSSLVRFSPEGRRTRTVQLPPRKVSSITFGGPARETAYVTTACPSVRATEGEGAGGLFRVELDVAGRPEFRSAVAV